MINEQNFIEVIMLLLGICLIGVTQGCTNWQGMEFKVGIGQYNGAQETKTFTRETKNEKESY